jgi:hypothetical protein
MPAMEGASFVSMSAPTDVARFSRGFCKRNRPMRVDPHAAASTSGWLAKFEHGTESPNMRRIVIKTIGGLTPSSLVNQRPSGKSEATGEP